MTWPRVTELKPPVKIVPEMKLLFLLFSSGRLVCEDESGMRSGVGGI